MVRPPQVGTYFAYFAYFAAWTRTMSVLELARKAYAKLKAERNGQAESPVRRDTDGEISEISEISPTRASSPRYLLVADQDGLGVVRAALDNTVRVAVDLETTGLDPRGDRIRLLSLSLDTIDGGTFVYLVDC